MTVASATPGASRVPKSLATGKLDAGWMSPSAILTDIGLTGLAAGALIFATGAATVDKLTLGTAGRLLVAGASAPAWSSKLAEGTISGLLTLSKSGSTAREATFPDAAITVAGSAAALTATRVPYATTGGLLTDSADLTYASGSLVIVGGAPASVLSGESKIGGGVARHGTAVYTGTLSASGQITSTVASGTAPFVVASPTVVANLNASLLLGQTWANPGAIGGTTPAAVSCTTLTASGNLTATGSDFTISTNTSDGSDNKRIFVTAGGGVAASRGAAFQMYGNEFPSLGGNMYFDAGEAGSIYFRYGASNTTGFSLGATGITTFAGATPGTPSAGQVLIGDGDVKAAGNIQLLGGVVTLGADNSISRVGANALSYNQSATVNGAYIAFYDLTNAVDRGYVGYGATLFSGAAITDFGFRSNGALKIATGGGYLALTIDTSQNADVAGNMNIGSGKVYKVNTVQVVGAQGAAVAAASAVSGTATSGGYGFTDATEFNSFVSGVNALKDQLNALLSRVRAHGLIAT